MTAKDFKAGAAKASEAGRISGAIREAAEAKEAKKAAPKVPHINLALTDEAFDYIKTVAKATGQTQQAFLQKIINDYMTEHKTAYKKAKDLLNSL